jgi:hypothetical protein
MKALAERDEALTPNSMTYGSTQNVASEATLALASESKSSTNAASSMFLLLLFLTGRCRHEAKMERWLDAALALDANALSSGKLTSRGDLLGTSASTPLRPHGLRLSSPEQSETCRPSCDLVSCARATVDAARRRMSRPATNGTETAFHAMNSPWRLSSLEGASKARSRTWGTQKVSRNPIFAYD